jgi:1-hydroxy-2-naphthoate dioxygenase
MNDDALAAFDAKLAKADIYGQWTSDRMLQSAQDGPRPAGEPHIWKWAAMRALLDEAASVMPESFTARRSLMFSNPGLPRGTTHTIAMGMQLIQAGEIAWAHRHSIAALRFTIQGAPGLFTVVDGEAYPMEDYDLVLTPGWTWHDHHNESDKPAIWLDVLDVPLVAALNQAFYEPFGEDRQPLAGDADAMSARLGPLRPAWEARPEGRAAARYPWKVAEAALKRMAGAEASPYDGVALEYVNPLTGGATLPTLTCWLQWLKPGQETKPHRRTSSAACFVVRGEGRTVVDGVELDWGPGDGFCIPNWAWHHHANLSAGEEAVLFSVHDMPLLEAIGLYREEPENTLRTTPLPPVAGDRARTG